MAFRFLVLGAGRGGTSLLAGLLDAHPSLEVGFEHGSIETLMDGGPGRSPTHPADIQVQHLRLATFRSVCDAEAATHASRTWGNKVTTEQLRGVALSEQVPAGELVPWFLRTLDAGQEPLNIVYILRDGRACVRSKVARTGIPWDDAVRRWSFSVDVAEALGEMTDRRVATLRFENLVQTPRPQLELACAALGVEFDEVMLSGTDNPKMLADYRQPGINPERASAGDLPEFVLELLAPGLQRAGYA